MLKGLIEALDKALVGTPDWVAIPVLLGVIVVAGVVLWRRENRREQAELDRLREAQAAEPKGD